MNNENTFENIKTKLTKPLAVVGIIAIMVFATWITVQGIKSTPAFGEFISKSIWPKINSALVSVTSLFVPAERINVSLDKTKAESGDTVNLYWKHISKNGNGIYTFFYTCVDKLSLMTAEKITVECDKELDINERTTLTVIPESKTAENIDVQMRISFKKDNDEIIKGAATLTVMPKTVVLEENTEINNSKPVTKVTPPTTKQSTVKKEIFNSYGDQTSIIPAVKTEKTYTLTASPAPTVQNAMADLAVNILEIGIIDVNTNVFSATSTAKSGERAAVRFEILNIGNKVTGGWTFNAVLPTYPAHIFHSDSQQSLSPGDKIQFTLGFDQIDTSLETGTISIFADPSNSVNEKNKDNNLAKTTIKISR